MERTSGNMQVVQGFFNGLEARNTEAMLSAFDENAYWDTPSGGAFSGRFSGRAGLGRMFKLLTMSRTEGHVVADLTLHADGDRVFAEFTWGTMTDSATRAPTRSLAVFELVFGKVARVREFEAGPPAVSREG